MGKRVESPSSINTFRQCKRKYYYQYIEKLPVPKNIHTLRGGIVHAVLDTFYSTDIETLTNETYARQLRVILQDLLVHEWGKQREDLLQLHLSQDILVATFDESLLMLLNWYEHFLFDLKEMVQEGDDVRLAFASLVPQREVALASEQYAVRGFADVIRTTTRGIEIIDYKTNNVPFLKDDIRLQLAIYALLYEEMYGQRPVNVGAFFLRDKMHMLDVDEMLLRYAKEEIEKIHFHTQHASSVSDYPRDVSPLCKWRTGQCAFYDVCKPHG